MCLDALVMLLLLNNSAHPPYTLHMALLYTLALARPVNLDLLYMNFHTSQNLTLHLLINSYLLHTNDIAYIHNLIRNMAQMKIRFTLYYTNILHFTHHLHTMLSSHMVILIISIMHMFHHLLHIFHILHLNYITHTLLHLMYMYHNLLIHIMCLDALVMLLLLNNSAHPPYTLHMALLYTLALARPVNHYRRNKTLHRHENFM
jgi:hypothetical protein